MKLKKKWILIGVGALLVVGAVVSAAGGGKNKEPDVEIATEAPAAVTATVAPTAAPKATQKPAATAKPTATPKPAAAPTEAPVQTLGPAPAEEAPAPDRAAPAADPTPTPAPERDYVINTNTGKFHTPTCSSVKDIKPGNRQDVHMTRDAVIAQGWQPCGKCKP